MKILFGFLTVAALAVAQETTVGAGINISVRTNEIIDVKTSGGRVFASVVDQDVTDVAGAIVIPKGTHAGLIVTKTQNRGVTLELESITVNGQRYLVAADVARMSGGQRDSIGRNGRTAGFVGGGAALGAIFAAVTGGSGVVTMGALAGAGAGAGTQVLTRGNALKIPVESLLTFRLEQPLKMVAADNPPTP